MGDLGGRNLGTYNNLLLHVLKIDYVGCFKWDNLGIVLKLTSLNKGTLSSSMNE